MNESNSLVRLIYASHKSKYVDGSELKKILNVAQANNAKTDVTGILLFNSGYFLQALEGTRAQVNELYQSIIDDKRHQKVQIIEFKDVTARSWGSWSMQLVSITEHEEHIYAKYSGELKFNPFALVSADAAPFLQEISHLDKGLDQ